MNIVLYISSEETKVSERLLNRICMDFSCDNIEIFNNMADFRRRIYSFPRKMDVAVILAPDDSQLSDLVQYREVLEDTEIILILPDQNRDTVSKGMRLYPRFLAYIDSNFDDVSAVLSKLSIKHTHDNILTGRFVA